ncbi:MAG TPA: hypothetical protein VKE98_12600 [Gemmataceae bacterium]|nr:hypothetical protein [Gemmataceae bacterium]
MSKTSETVVKLEISSADQLLELSRLAARRNWGWSLLLVGWLHLLAFSFCYYLTIVRDYHDASGYLAIWLGELAGMWLIFRLCGGPRIADPAQPLELFIRRVWIAYFLLAFNLGSMNTLRGHALFEFFPATASFASFAFIMMSLVLSWRFFAAVVVMYASSLLMAANLIHAYLIFALAWWLVLNGIGVSLIWNQRRLGADDWKP